MKASQAEEDRYGYIKSVKTTGSRLDLNDLLKRIEDQKVLPGGLVNLEEAKIIKQNVSKSFFNKVSLL